MVDKEASLGVEDDESAEERAKAELRDGRQSRMDFNEKCVGEVGRLIFVPKENASSGDDEVEAQDGVVKKPIDAGEGKIIQYEASDEDDCQEVSFEPRVHSFDALHNR